jgi:thiamine transporter
MSPGPDRRPSSSLLAEIGVSVALAFVLAFFRLANLPAGGQVSLEMLPLLVLARRRGARAGAAAGALFGLAHIWQEPFLYHPFQVVLDYPLAFAAAGLAGLFPRGQGGDVAAALVAGAARYLCHVLSGVLFLDLFIPVATPPNRLLYSLGYNATYMVPSTLACALLLPAITRAMDRMGR